GSSRLITLNGKEVQPTLLQLRCTYSMRPFIATVAIVLPTRRVLRSTHSESPFAQKIRVFHGEFSLQFLHIFYSYQDLLLRDSLDALHPAYFPGSAMYNSSEEQAVL